MDSLIMSAGEIEYKAWDKPVVIDEELLMSLTGDYSCEVCDEHDGAELTHVNSVYMKDGDLYASFDDDVSLEGCGYSPVISYAELEEYEDYYKPVVGTSKILSVDRVANPKNYKTVVYNGEDTPKIIDKGVDKMSDELQDKIQENGALRQQLNDKTKLEETLRSQNKDLQDVIDSQKKELKELKAQLEDGNNELKAELESTSKKLKEYQNKEREVKLSLAKSVAESQIEDDVEERDEAIKSMTDDLSNLSESTLRAMKEKFEKQSSKNRYDTGYKGAAATSQDDTLQKLDEREEKGKVIDENSSFEDIKQSFEEVGIHL